MIELVKSMESLITQLRDLSLQNSNHSNNSKDEKMEQWFEGKSKAYSMSANFLEDRLKFEKLVNNIS